jgi:3-oxoacyl-[acyl-carrier-protein] synthase III
MMYFIWDEYGVVTSESSIRRVLQKNKWTKKKVDIALVLQKRDFLMLKEMLMCRLGKSLKKEIKCSETLGCVLLLSLRQNS